MTRFTRLASVCLVGLVVALAACDEQTPDTSTDDASERVAAVITDADIRASIEAELERSPFVDAKQVDVSVHEGDVVLRGRVDSISERDEAFKCAYQGGAHSVDDRLEVAHEVRIPAVGDREHPS